ncbi:MAG TPA: RNA polymerase sigma factor [bacterium]|nr:RNA polymerase sigma factor [bacterium]
MDDFRYKPGTALTEVTPSRNGTGLARRTPGTRFGGPLNEAEIIDRCTAGDQEAWALVYERFYSYIYQLVKGRNSQLADEDAEDICHEVFEDLLKGLNSFQRKSLLKTFIHTLTINRVRQHYRKVQTQKRGGEVEKCSLDEIAYELPDEQTAAPETLAFQMDEHRRLQAAIAALPPELGRVVDMRYTQNLKYREIADALGIPEGSVGAQIQKALLALRDLMQVSEVAV